MSPSRRKWKFRVRHIVEAIEKIQSYTRGMSYEAFCDRSVVIDGVLLNLILVGEAARSIPSEFQAAHPQLPWEVMRGMRNVLVHEYERVKLEVVWKTIRDDLPPLVPLLAGLLERASED